jgi:hypothetical protein
MLLQNMSVAHGLVNGSVGVVRGICYSNGQRTPALPDCVFVEFDGYSGPCLFGSGDQLEGRRLAPIKPEPI